MRFSATEGAGREIRATLVPAGAGQRLELVIADAAALAQTLLAPLADVKLPPGEMAETLLAMGGVPATLA